MMEAVLDNSTQEGNRKIIQVGNVDKDFEVATEYIKVISNITFEIYESEFVMLTGPSGCGKSTLLHIMNGWEAPTYGDVLLLGEDLYSLEEEKRTAFSNAIMTLVTQTPYWIGSLSVVENIEIPYLLAGFSKKEAQKRAWSLLRLLQLEELVPYKPIDLSGGQQQRVNLLRSIITNPDIIMADEPTGNLDSINTKFVMDFFLKMNKELNRTIIMATHNPNFFSYATRVIEIGDGTVKNIQINDPNFKSKKASGDILDLSIDDIKIQKKEVF